MELVAKLLADTLTTVAKKALSGAGEAAIPAARQAVFYLSETWSSELVLLAIVIGIACIIGIVIASSASCCFGSIRCCCQGIRCAWRCAICSFRCVGKLRCLTHVWCCCKRRAPTLTIGRAPIRRAISFADESVGSTATSEPIAHRLTRGRAPKRELPNL